MTLRQHQSAFARDAAKLIEHAFAIGYEVTLGEAYRTAEQHALNVKAGKSKATTSPHMNRLAIDLNLFVDGKYRTDTAAYAELGKYWVSLAPENRWGGDWNKNGDHRDERFQDGNHFERKV